MKVADFDIVFVSYDEPNADENYADLLSKFPNAKRVHGIKGFDPAHRAAAELSETDHVFIIDGDNKVTKDLAYAEFELDDTNYVYSWSAKNVINSLIYGNGGLKLWPKHILQNVSSHNKGGVDWCWEIPYYNMNDWFSFSICNATPYQAFRYGLREAVKLSLVNGEYIDLKAIDKRNFQRLYNLLTIGMDVTNGSWAILGARHGLWELLNQRIEISQIADYDWILDKWDNDWFWLREENHLITYSIEIGDYLRQYKDLNLPDLTGDQSSLMKNFLIQTPRKGIMIEALADKDYMINNNFVQKEI